MKSVKGKKDMERIFNALKKCSMQNAIVKNEKKQKNENMLWLFV